MRWFELRRNVRDALHGALFLRYEKELRNEALELNDLFLLMCYMEIVGLPNPATLYFDADMRFMQGTYVGVDGKTHQNTFGFI